MGLTHASPSTLHYHSSACMTLATHATAWVCASSTNTRHILADCLAVVEARMLVMMQQHKPCLLIIECTSYKRHAAQNMHVHTPHSHTGCDVTEAQSNTSCGMTELNTREPCCTLLVHASLHACKLQCSSNLKGASKPSWERCAAMLACKGFRLSRGKGTPTSLNPI